MKNDFFVNLHHKIKRKGLIMATAIRAIPTLYGETAQRFEQEAAATEQNPGTQDYCHESELVIEYLKTTNIL